MFLEQVTISHDEVPVHYKQDTRFTLTNYTLLHMLIEKGYSTTALHLLEEGSSAWKSKVTINSPKQKIRTMTVHAFALFRGLIDVAKRI